MSTRPLTRIVILLTIATLACSESITCDCVGEARLQVSSEGGGFLVRNTSGDRDLAVALVVKGSLVLIDGDCTNWAPRVPPTDLARVENDQVIGFFDEAEIAVVHWCTLRDDEVLEIGRVEVPFS